MRSTLRWTGIALFAGLGVFFILFGALYASVDNLLWFHAAAVPQSSLEAVRPLYFALMKLIGGSSIALGVLGLYLALGSLRSGSKSAGIVLGVAFAIPLVMAAIVAEGLAKTTGAPTSWHLMGVLLGIDAAAVLANRASRSTR